MANLELRDLAKLLNDAERQVEELQRRIDVMNHTLRGGAIKWRSKIDNTEWVETRREQGLCYFNWDECEYEIYE